MGREAERQHDGLPIISPNLSVASGCCSWMQSTEASTLIGSVQRFQDLRPVVRCAREMPRAECVVLDAARKGEDVRQRLHVTKRTRRWQLGETISYCASLSIRWTLGASVEWICHGLDHSRWTIDTLFHLPCRRWCTKFGIPRESPRCDR